MGGKSTSKRSRRPSRPFSDTFAAPIVLGGLFTAAFYGGIAALPPDWTFLRRYFCSHPLEYATAGLFFIAMGTLLLKFTRLGTERFEFRSQLTSDMIAGLDQNVFHQRLAEIEPARSSTWLIRRLNDSTAFVRSRGTASGLEDHLRYLGELAGDQLHRSYAFVRTITWAVPILGFLGTVIGITMAIANVTPEQLDTSLGTVTGGLAVAFDTTALALALSIVLVFSSFLVERTEQQLLSDVEEFSMRHLPKLFGASLDDAVANSGLDPNTAQILAQAMDTFVDRQMVMWEQQLGDLRGRWEALVQLGEQQGQLVRLEEQLCHNLEAIRVSETFDQTLNNLTAAVHLLSARAGASGPPASPPTRRAA